VIEPTHKLSTIYSGKNTLLT